MSKVSKFKRINEALADDPLPEGGQFIARIENPAGNNLHEVLSVREGPERFLVSMPTRLRKSYYVKRGDYVICQPIEEGNKVGLLMFFVGF